MRSSHHPDPEKGRRSLRPTLRHLFGRCCGFCADAVSRVVRVDGVECDQATDEALTRRCDDVHHAQPLATLGPVIRRQRSRRSLGHRRQIDPDAIIAHVTRVAHNGGVDTTMKTAPCLSGPRPGSCAGRRP